MGFDPLEQLPAGLNSLNRLIADLDSGKVFSQAYLRDVFVACYAAMEKLGEGVKYLDASLTASVTGELPARFDLNQMLLAKRALSYNAYIAGTDPRDKTRQPGHNDAMVPPSKRE